MPWCGRRWGGNREAGCVGKGEEGGERGRLEAGRRKRILVLYKKDADSIWPASSRTAYSWSCFPPPASRLAPESSQGRTVRRFAQLLESALTDLSDALSSNSHQRADLFQRHRVRALLQTVIEVENLALARGEVFPENAIDELAHEMEVSHVFDLGPIYAGEALTERASLAVRTINRRIERDLGCRHLLCGANCIGSLFEQAANFVVGRIALEDLRENCLCASELDQLRILIERNSNASCLLSQRLEDRLANPPYGVGDELDALVRIELSDCFEETFVPDCDELAKVEPMPLILFDVRDYETKVSGDQPLSCFLVARLSTTRKSSLFFSVGDEWKLLYVLEVLVERGGRGGTEEAFGSTLARCLHKPLGSDITDRRAWVARPVFCWTRTLTRGALNRQQPRFMPKAERVDLWASFGLLPS